MLLQTNPGSIVNLEVTDRNKFQYMFIAFATSIQGFSYCRPVINTDATHLKGKYRGVLFTAIFHDANQQIFPLAIGKVKDVFGENPVLVIVSDRHCTISSAVVEAFPRAFHGVCIYHLLKNLKTKFKSKTKELEQHYLQAAKSYNLQEFHVLFYTLCLAVPGAKEYLESVGLDRWTRSHAPCRRYNIMTTNISESFNAVLVKVRELPITTFINEVRLLCQRWFHQRRTKSSGCSSRMSSDVENKLEQRRDRAQTMAVSVLFIRCQLFYAFKIYASNLNLLNIFQKTPYEAYDLCSLYYSREFWHEMYRGVIQPVPHISSWSIPSQISTFDLQPPDVRTVTERHRKRRILSTDL
ncbi:hypothetical protein UlMin_037069 [Ulmus minor]